MSAFSRILGQPAAVRTLERALTQGRVHHAYRFEGPEGVGKEMAALALAQSFVCTSGAAIGCGQCAACGRAIRIAEVEPHVPQHPDVVLVGRGVYPHTLIGAKEASGISVEQIRRVVLGRTGYAPHEGRALLFIVRDAEELTTSAANALLKTLEEPRQGVHFVLLSSRPNRLLDTIRSRTLPVRFAPLSPAVLRTILERHGRPTDLIALADGSASRALTLADDEQRGALQSFVSSVDAALSSPDLRASLDLAHGLPRDKGELRQRLLAFASHLQSGVHAVVESAPHAAEQGAQRYRVVQSALDALERNVSPALAVEAMLIELRATT
jgi:DNA polymerase III subunit delta'